MVGHVVTFKNIYMGQSLIGERKRKFKHFKVGRRSGHVRRSRSHVASVESMLVGVWFRPSWGMDGFVGIRLETFG